MQIGLFGKPVAWDLDQLCYKEIVATGSNASAPPPWARAVELTGSGKVQPKPLITHRFPVTDWEQAFATFEDGTGIKTILTPVE